MRALLPTSHAFSPLSLLLFTSLCLALSVSLSLSPSLALCSLALFIARPPLLPLACLQVVVILKFQMFDLIRPVYATLHLIPMLL